MTGLRILTPGLLTTVQDLGRWGYQAWGVPVGGAMDPVSHRVANALVGNPPAAATLEMTIVGPSLATDAPVRIGVAGARFEVRVGARPLGVPGTCLIEPGERLVVGAAAAGGARAYLAVAGGISTKPVFGSRATDLRAGFGGLEGRALRRGDVLPVGAADRAPAAALHGTPLATSNTTDEPLRLLPGPHAAMFPFLLHAMCTRTYTVSSRSDRMGYRLEAEGLEQPPPGHLISIPTVTGTVQVLPDGTPVLLMVDRQTTGGYAQVAVVISADLPRAGQLAPGDPVRFTVCSREEAVRALVALEGRMLATEGRT